MKQWSRFLITARLRVHGVAAQILVTDKVLKTPHDKVQMRDGVEKKAEKNHLQCTLMDQQSRSWYL